MAGSVKAEPQKAPVQRAPERSSTPEQASLGRPLMPLSDLRMLSRPMPLNGAPNQIRAVLNLQRTIGNRATGQLLQRLATGPIQPKLMVGPAGDTYEREADAAADRVAAGEPVERLLRLPAAGLHREPETQEEEPVERQPAQEEEMRATPLQRQEMEEEEPVQAKAGDGEKALDTAAAGQAMARSGSGQPLGGDLLSRMEGSFGADFSAVRVHTGPAAQDANRAINARAFTHGSDIYLGRSESAINTRLMAHELTHVVQQNGGPLHSRRHSPAAPLSLLSSSQAYVQRDVSEARDRLRELERRRAAGETVTERDQRAAEHEALSSSQEALGAAHDAAGSEIANVQTRILEQISVIESARARGYIRAITELNARGLDNDADYTAFGIALGGNLLWALSGIVPMIPVAAFTIRGLGPFFAAVCRNQEVWTAVVGVVGAMTAQFSSGLPSGTSSSGVKSAMIDRLTAANSNLCNHLRRRFYLLLTEAIAHAAPEESTDAQTYAAELEVGLSHALYGDIYYKHLNDGDLVSASAVERDARNQLLAQYVAGSSAIDTHLIGSTDIGATRSASEADVVDAAISLLGGQGALRFEPYELVFNQVRTAAMDLGVTLINFDPASVSGPLSRGRDVFIRATNWNPSAIFTGSPNRWMNPLHTSSIVECHPRITNEPYMQLRHIQNIESVKLRPSQMENLRGQIWSMKKVWFQARGGPDDTSGFIQVTDIPDTFFIKYQIQD